MKFKALYDKIEKMELAIYIESCYYYKVICKGNEWDVKYWQHGQREDGMVRTVCVQYKAFARELRSELFSRILRLIALQIVGVNSAGKLRLMANCGWYRGGTFLRPLLGRRSIFL